MSDFERKYFEDLARENEQRLQAATVQSPPTAEIAKIMARIVSDARNIDVRASNGVMIESVETLGNAMVIHLSNGTALQALLTPCDMPRVG